MKKIGGKTLQEIQDMPMSKRHAHMRKYVSPDWAREKQPEGKEAKYRITVNLTVRAEEEEVFEVFATNEENAEIEAEEYIKDNFSYEDYEIEEVELLK